MLRLVRHIIDVSPGNYLLIHIVLKVIVSRILRFYINDHGNIQWLNFDSKFLKKNVDRNEI